MKRASMLAFACLLYSLPGCREDKWNPGEEKRAGIVLPTGQLYVLELDHVTADKLEGGDEAKSELRHFLDDHQLLLWTSEQRHVLTMGLTALAASYGRASYKRVRARSDHLYVHLPTVQLMLIQDDGTRFTLDLAGLRIEPAKQADGGLDEAFRATGRGTFSVERGTARFSGEFDAEWFARRDEQPPEVTIVGPPAGLVSGAFDVYFNEPVEVGEVSSKIFLRDGQNKVVKTRISVDESDIDGYATRLRVDTLDLLPFDQTLTLAVGTQFKDLKGNQLVKPVVSVVHTPKPPPEMGGGGHDFGEGKNMGVLRLQGTHRVVKSYRGLEPSTGRLLVLEPPRAGSRSSSALVTRLKVPHDADYVQVRVMKAAETRDTHTPCLRYTMAQPSGLLWNVECGPTDVPTLKLSDQGREYFATPWMSLNIKVDGQRGKEVVVVLEARPLEPEMPPGSKPVFILDALRTVRQGEDPTTWKTSPVIGDP